MTDTNTGWTQIPPAPKVPNFWQGYGYTLHYGSPGWDVHLGTHSTKETLGDVLFHAKAAKDAKQWAVDNPVEAAPAPKPKRSRSRAKGKTAAAEAAPEPPADEQPDVPDDDDLPGGDEPDGE